MTGVRLVGIQGLLDRFDKLEKGLNTQDLLDTIGAIMLNRIRTRFLNQEAPDGSRWEESFGADHRRNIGTGGGTLFDTGDLFHSISLGRSGVDGRSIFTTIPYAEKHNFGLDGEEKREFLGFSEEDERITDKFIMTRIKGLV